MEVEVHRDGNRRSERTEAAVSDTPLLNTRGAPVLNTRGAACLLACWLARWYMNQGRQWLSDGVFVHLGLVNALPYLTAHCSTLVGGVVGEGRTPRCVCLSQGCGEPVAARCHPMPSIVLASHLG